MFIVLNLSAFWGTAAVKGIDGMYSINVSNYKQQIRVYIKHILLQSGGFDCTQSGHPVIPQNKLTKMCAPPWNPLKEGT